MIREAPLERFDMPPLLERLWLLSLVAGAWEVDGLIGCSKREGSASIAFSSLSPFFSFFFFVVRIGWSVRLPGSCGSSPRLLRILEPVWGRRVESLLSGDIPLEVVDSVLLCRSDWLGRIGAGALSAGERPPVFVEGTGSSCVPGASGIRPFQPIGSRLIEAPGCVMEREGVGWFVSRLSGRLISMEGFLEYEVPGLSRDVSGSAPSISSFRIRPVGERRKGS